RAEEEAARVARIRARMAAEEAQRQEELRRRRWGNGPALQIYGGYGYFLYTMPGLYENRPATTARYDVTWQNWAPTVGVMFSNEVLVLGASWTSLPLDNTSSGQTLNISGGASVLSMLTGEFGIQGVDPIHAFRITVAAGLDLNGNGLITGLNYRSMFR